MPYKPVDLGISFQFFFQAFTHQNNNKSHFNAKMYKGKFSLPPHHLTRKRPVTFFQVYLIIRGMFISVE